MYLRGMIQIIANKKKSRKNGWHTKLSLFVLPLSLGILLCLLMKPFSVLSVSYGSFTRLKASHSTLEYTRNDEETEPFLMLRLPGVVIRSRWSRRGFQLQTNEWNSRSEELQSDIKHVTQCNQWYWCYECHKIGTLNQDNIVSSYPLEIIRCSECLRHRFSYSSPNQDLATLPHSQVHS
ncbi:unnamed protein product [Cuscuta europaea]|uniref:Uncharacterized protein n=1 Tax=Cuscuta europaea TaxID=41803 RepID=A0A9P0ZE23_CUSEU|nr:unnamed protein product [Cuscuta europaea]